MLQKIMILCLLIFASPLFASAITEELEFWTIKSINDGMFFLLGPESEYKIIFRVNNKLQDGLPADPVFISCNGKTNYQAPGSVLTCYPNFSDVSFLYTDPGIFKNGSMGTYQYMRLGQ